MARNRMDVVVSDGELERVPRPFGRLGEFERLFDEFFDRSLTSFGWSRPLPGGAMPDVDIIDRDDEVIVRAELAGYRKEDIEVSVSGNWLTLRGESRSDDRDESGDYYRQEIAQGSFARTLSLPAEVDESKAKASMKDGILELVLPKLEKARRRTIVIS